MTTLLLVFSTSFIVCLFLTPLVRLLAVRWNLVDRPDGHRKAHTKPMPVAGGVAILIALCVAVLGARYLPVQLREEVKTYTQQDVPKPITIQDTMAYQGKQFTGLLLAPCVI